MTSDQRPSGAGGGYSPLSLTIASIPLLWGVACAYVVGDGYLGTVSLSFPTPFNLVVSGAIVWAGVAIARRLAGHGARPSKATWPIIVAGLAIWGWATGVILYEALF